MGIRKFNPTSPGRRFGSGSDFSEITRKAPRKSLTRPLRKSGGRNNHGHTTARFRGGGHKRRYRLIDFRRDKDGVPAIVDSIEYDPNRSARIALLKYLDGEWRYILAPEGLKVGQKVFSGPEAEPRVGNSMALQNIPVGMTVHAVELEPGRGAKLARTAGVQAQLAAREGDYATVVLPSGEIRKVHVKCRATIGVVGNSDHQNVKLGKAGRKRWLGRRPHVRGVAMNPVAHPMGGGEGRSGGGRHPCSPTGKLSKGGRTRPRKARSSQFIIRRRKSKR